MSDINNIKPTAAPNVNSVRNSVKDNKPSSAKTGISEASSVATDKVSLTDNATQLQSLQKAVAEAPVVNKDRVAALRAAIDNGSYQVDAKKLARNMIDFEGKLK